MEGPTKLITELPEIQKIETEQFLTDCVDPWRDNEWRMGPLHWDMHDHTTAWGIFTLDPTCKQRSDILPVASPVPYWEGLELVRAHNFQLGIYKASDPRLEEMECGMCHNTFKKFQLNSMAVCGACMTKKA